MEMSPLAVVGAKCDSILLPWVRCGRDREMGFPATGYCSGERERIERPRVLRNNQGGV